MKLTKKQENEITKVYDTWLHSYLNGDIETYDSFLDDDYHFIGSTDNEEFLNRENTTNFFRETADQLAGKTDLRNNKIVLEKFGDLVILTHVFDAWFIHEGDWSYYGRFRFSSTLQEKKSGWRFVYQHFSTTDSKAEEGETIGFDQVRSENLELREAIKRRTKELEEKNRELEIESALERIRSKVTTMIKSSDLLDIVVTMREEFTRLGHRADYFWHMMWLPDKFEKAMTSGDGKRIGMIMELPRDFHSHYEGMDEWEASDEPIMVLALEVEEALDYIDKMVTLGDFKRVDPNAPTPEDIKHIGGVTFIMARTSHGEIGFSLPGVVKNPPKEDLLILERLAAVFDLAHRRFIDLQKSENQAREVQIELGLEKVRSRAMAMQNSSELSDLVDTVFKELAELDFALQACIINLIDIENLSNTVWMKSPDVGKTPDSYLLKFEDYPFHDAMKEGYLQREVKYIYTIQGAEKKDYDKYLFTDTEFSKISKKAKDSFTSLEKYVCSFTFSNFGGLQTIGEEPLSDENLDILARFGKVFDLTYTRFNDLKLAEDQARESRIELALERVRAKTMAMQHSDELLEVASVMFQQVKSLGVSQWNCGFNIWEKGDQDFTYYPGSPDGKIIPFSCKIPLNEHPVFKRFEASKKRGEELLVYEKKGKEQIDHYNYMLSLPGVGDFLRNMMDADFELPTYQIDHVANFAYGNLIFITYEPFPDMHDVFKRFAKVFEQTYTRFLDLQKSEAQAREAEIELALERVRVRTMGMQQSHELGDVATVLFKELNELVDNLWTCGFVLCEEGRNEDEWWLSTEGGFIPPMLLPNVGDDTHYNMHQAWKKGSSYHTEQIEGKALQEHYDWLMTIPAAKEVFDGMKASGFERPSWQKLHCAYFSYGYLVMITKVPCPEEDIFKRFAKVFDQTYTRFLDLQKSEAQAREARIETALERVRSRTMAMHNSTELAETAAVLFQQLKELGVEHDRTNIGIVDDENRKINFWLTTQKGNLVDNTFPASINESNSLKTIYKGFKEKKKSIIVEQKGAELKRWISFITDKLGIPYTAPTRNEVRFQNVGYISQGMLIATSTNPLNEESVRILERFAAVFEQTYTRFLDLQKAEAQAREAQIEAALERVRSRSMAMHKSEELLDVISVVSQQLQLLEFKFVHVSFANNDDSQEYKFWTSAKGLTKPTRFTTPYIDLTVFNNLRAAIEKSLEFCADIIDKKEHRLWHEHLLKHGGSKVFSEEDNKHIMSRGMARSMAINPNIVLIVANYASIPYSESDNKIIARFGKVFDQSYTRFLDLQKAEAQAREGQIEAALERVRSRTMAMHNSGDVKETVKTFFDEVLKLGIDQTIRCGIGILEGHEGMETWSANATEEGVVEMRVGMLNMKIHPMLRGLKKAWEKGEKGYSYYYTAEDVLKYYQALNNEPEYPFNADLNSLPKKEYHNSFFFSSGIIFAFTENPMTEESSAVLHRFADVFGQTYRRFLDLRKAEDQAKEAQVEAALEKVRSRTMAMQSSQELQEAANLLFVEVQNLGINAWSAGYNILSEDKKSSVCWMSSEGELQDPFPLYYTEEASFKEMGKFLKGEKNFFVQELTGKALVRHYDYMKSLPELRPTFKHLESVGLSLPTYQVNHLCKFSQGYLLFITYEKVPEAHEVFQRFTKVFEQTYTRFLDLKKAENQSKEVQIELALERVRASTMAMHKSEQLAETAEVLFEQFDLMGVVPDRISIAIYNDKKRVFELWATDQSGGVVNHMYDFSIDEPTCMAKTYKAWIKGQETCIIDLKGKEFTQWVEYVKNEAKMEIDESNLKGRRVQHSAFFSEGYLMLSSHVPIKEESLQLLLRFAKVFQQTYTRFLDLKKAEKQAREAIKHASVDRVRAEIASMRTSNDLQRITPLIWNELKTLNVPFIRCGVFIVDEEAEQIQTHLSAPDGRALATFQLAFEDTEPLAELLPHWQRKEMYTDHWDKEGFIESTNMIMEKGDIQSKETYLTKYQPDNLYLHFLPFLQGMLYVGSEVPLNEDALSLVQNLANAFSSAYSRYEDFNKLELANKKIEKTLTDLKQTQSQLIQSEKMASLGELTAGIAHEIQNPLNFVNNFSEVSAELVDEMNEEMDLGNLEDVKEISIDLKQNLEKINHHGKRAGEIVKGMLQHSRTSTGQKELTDINALTDEYLRLAYHGLRAKDKSFNAKMESHLDADLPKLEVIPQDIGRVILNMITNAFHAVSEKKKLSTESYEPEVTVHTRKVKGNVEIKVVDNGNGMPKTVLDKIFQPFFTTKPTGQGTGLGLSLSYDIVKAHGGELLVETKEEKGTEFRIILPIN